MGEHGTIVVSSPPMVSLPPTTATPSRSVSSFSDHEEEGTSAPLWKTQTVAPCSVLQFLKSGAWSGAPDLPVPGADQRSRVVPGMPDRSELKAHWDRWGTLPARPSSAPSVVFGAAAAAGRTRRTTNKPGNRRKVSFDDGSEPGSEPGESFLRSAYSSRESLNSLSEENPHDPSHPRTEDSMSWEPPHDDLPPRGSFSWQNFFLPGVGDVAGSWNEKSSRPTSLPPALLSTSQTSLFSHPSSEEFFTPKGTPLHTFSERRDFSPPRSDDSTPPDELADVEHADVEIAVHQGAEESGVERGLPDAVGVDDNGGRVGERRGGFLPAREVPLLAENQEPQRSGAGANGGGGRPERKNAFPTRRVSDKADAFPTRRTFSQQKDFSPPRSDDSTPPELDDVWGGVEHAEGGVGVEHAADVGELSVHHQGAEEENGSDVERLAMAAAAAAASPDAVGDGGGDEERLEEEQRRGPLLAGEVLFDQSSNRAAGAGGRPERKKASKLGAFPTRRTFSAPEF